MAVQLAHSGKKLWSMNALAGSFDLDRRTVKKRLENVSPDGKAAQGHPGWYISTAAPHLVGQSFVGGPDSDPDELPPRERLDHYRAEKEKMLVAQAQGLLIPYDDTAEEMARVIKLVANFFDTLPDVIEREVGISGKAVEVIERECDRLRNTLADQLEDE